MYYYETLLAISSISAFVFVVWLHRLRKHDKVLYRFCQVRREILEVLRNRGFEMNKQDYFAIRDLLEVVNGTIHHYNHCKSTVFNFRTLTKMIRDLRESGQAIAEIKTPKDPELAKVFDSFRMAMVGAFLTYTPFFRSEITARIVLYLLVAICRFFGSIGIKSWCKVSDDLSWALSQINNQHNHHLHA